MLDGLEEIAGPNFVMALMWTLFALLVLVIVLVVVKLVRSMTFGTFVAGGRNRKTRLAVMDAAAVDSHRRLVLVRRDDVEHLLLIGGPTDVVVEQDIRLGQPRRPALLGDNGMEAPAPRPRQPEQPQQIAPGRPQVAPAPQPRALERATPLERPAPVRQPVREAPAPQPVRQQPRVQPVAMPPAAPLAAAEPPPARAPYSGPSTNRSTYSAPQPARTTSSIDDTLLKELEVTFETTTPPRKTSPAAPTPAPAPVELSLDDEMTKLLGELSSQKR